MPPCCCLSCHRVPLLHNCKTRGVASNRQTARPSVQPAAHKEGNKHGMVPAATIPSWILHCPCNHRNTCVGLPSKTLQLLCYIAAAASSAAYRHFKAYLISCCVDLVQLGQKWMLQGLQHCDFCCNALQYNRRKNTVGVHLVSHDKCCRLGAEAWLYDSALCAVLR